MPVYAWLIVIVALIILEASTFSLVSIWFALGAIAALIAALLGADPSTQFIIFVVVSAFFLAVTWPFARNILKARNENAPKTNVDATIGKTGVVITKVDNLAPSGLVRLDGQDWTARSANPEITIDEGKTVEVAAIEGVKLIVKEI